MTYDKEYHKQYFKKNKTRISIRKKEHYENNKDRILKEHKEYYYDNKDQVLERVHKYYDTHTQQILEYKYEFRKHLITFKGEKISLDYIPRIGVCNWCRAVVSFDCKKTHIHHDENRYDPENPARYTIELCASCHNKETWRLGPIH